MVSGIRMMWKGGETDKIISGLIKVGSRSLQPESLSGRLSGICKRSKSTRTVMVLTFFNTPLTRGHRA